MDFEGEESEMVLIAPSKLVRAKANHGRVSTGTVGSPANPLARGVTAVSPTRRVVGELVTPENLDRPTDLR
jgi:hypothetical protein